MCEWESVYVCVHTHGGEVRVASGKARSSEFMLILLKILAEIYDPSPLAWRWPLGLQPESKSGLEAEEFLLSQGTLFY